MDAKVKYINAYATMADANTVEYPDPKSKQVFLLCGSFFSFKQAIFSSSL
jgi:hypothetical protein